MEVSRSVLLPYAAQDMFDLVEQAEKYPEFVPWCTHATIFERSDDWVAARIEFSFLQLQFGFQTRNSKQRPHWLKVCLIEGPFKHFQGDWDFRPLGEHGCKVSFTLSFEVADGRLDALAAPVVERVAREMVEAFVKRAQATLTEFAPAQSPPAAPAHTASSQVAAPPLVIAQVPWAPACGPMPAGPTRASASENPVTTTDPALIAAVQASPLAQHLNPAETAVLAGVMSAQAHPANTVLAREGASDNHLYIVCTGSLGVVRGLGSPEQTQIATLGPGEFAHELGFLDGAQRYASLVCVNDSQVLVLERQALESLIESHPRVLYGVMRAIVRTVHRVQTRLSMQAAELTNYIFKQHGRY